MNNMYITEVVTERVTKAYPDGVDPLSARQIPRLLDRIRELENALTPFARVGMNLTSGDQELQYCYRDDCLRALHMLDPKNSERPPITYEYPM